MIYFKVISILASNQLATNEFCAEQELFYVLAKFKDPSSQSILAKYIENPILISLWALSYFIS